MNKYTFEKIKDSDGDIRAYKLGRFYLIKHYYWNNNYEWLIQRDSTFLGFGSDITRKIEAGEVEFGHSCKDGKQRLIELYEQEERKMNA